MLRRSLAEKERGSAIVELAVVLPVLMVLALGVGDFGRVMYTSITLSHAARAGAQYGAQSNAATGDTTGIRIAAEQEAADITPIQVASEQICGCPSGADVACTGASTCPSYGTPQVFVQVTVSKSFRTLVPYPGVPSSVPLSQTATVRRQ